MGERARREGERERRGGSIGIKIILCRNLTERDKRGEESKNFFCKAAMERRRFEPRLIRD